MSTIPATPAETTGEIVLTWSPDGPVVTAPALVAVPVMELFEMRRVPGDPRAVELPGGIRYLIGAAHRRWRGTVYLHRMPGRFHAFCPDQTSQAAGDEHTDWDS